MLSRRYMLAAGSALALAGCATANPEPAPVAEAPPPPPAPPPAPPPPSAQQMLAAFMDKTFEEALSESPELVTSLGLDKGERAAAKSKFHDASFAAVERRKKMTLEQLAALRRIDRGQLKGNDAVNYDSLKFDAETAAEYERRYDFGSQSSPYLISQITGAYQDAPDFLANQHTIETAADCEAYVARLVDLGRLMNEEVERVRHDVGLGVIPPDFVLKGAIASLKSMQTAPEKSPFVTGLTTRAKEKGIAGDWMARASKAYTDAVRPALARQTELLTSLQPRATHDAGVWRLPDGEAYYALALASQTTTTMSPQEVHKLGLDVTRDLSARADVLFKKLGMTKGTVGQRYDGLYKKKTGIYPNTDAAKAKLVADLNKLVVQMEGRLPQYFATLPKTPLQIQRIPKETEQGASTHYSEGSLDGTRPGIYWINLRDTAEAPFWWMPTTTFHEGVPGHHLQLTLQRQADLPLIRKIQGFGAYSEGWALYSEQLAQEMGFYDGNPLWELGYIHDALLRSGRLVTDTGLHALRWTREKAIQELSGIDGDPISLSTQEIERYCVWPGQACSYMVGKLTILRLRDKAKAALGPAFDIRTFHDAILLSGAMPMTVLENLVDGYIASKKA